MPFNFHLKKSRQYIVSKNQYIICVNLLDKTSIECTLNNDSLGQECLINVTQRFGLSQPEFFGLTYICRHGAPTMRWVDVNKPLKRQLQKEAKSFSLYLQVMYYINDIRFIQDEMTRYHYYLQLKNDIVEDKIHCHPRQATLLASYSLKAEFGNYDSESHILEYLQQHNIFSKAIIDAEPGGLDALINSTISQYAMLANATQAAAEEYYITMAMQLEGYSYETFSAKDESNNDVIIAFSINGILVDNPNTQATDFFRWKDINNVTNHKKAVRIECISDIEYAKQVSFRDSHTAKYIWRFCMAQYKFYKQQESVQFSNNRLTSSYFDNETNESCEQAPYVNLEANGTEEYTHWTSYNDLSTSTCPVMSVSSTDIDNLRALLPSYRPAPDYETAMQMKSSNSRTISQPYYANQSTIVGADLCFGNVANHNRY